MNSWVSFLFFYATTGNRWRVDGDALPLLTRHMIARPGWLCDACIVPVGFLWRIFFFIAYLPAVLPELPLTRFSLV